jgi:amino acid adenylation domain-containing protein
MTAGTVVELVAGQVRARPDAVAVADSAGELSYAELDRRSGQVAGRLLAAGVRRGDVVGVQAERSAAAIVLLLGVLQAGAGYLALDRRLPGQRRAELLADACARIVLTETAAAPAGPDPLTVQSGPDDLAYVAYTSGSTGRPKGVRVPHRAVVRLVAEPDFAALGPADRVLQLAPLSFDASTFEVWGALAAGARLVVAPPGELTPTQLGKLIAAERISALWLTAGLFHRLVDAGPHRLRGVRELLAGGDVLSVPHVNRLVAELPGTALTNGYGPTENTTFTCCHRVTAPITAGSVPIGRPIRGTGVRVLDDRLRPVPDGQPGELYATGAGLADGYLGNPAATAERFVADPYAAEPGGRMYRTGDLVRRLPGGELEFLGRRDRQVKIRGFRVEPGEVEAAATALPGVRGVAVLCRARASGERYLAAVVAGTDLAPGQLRAQLGAVLPAYAVPALIRVVAQLPLTGNGKVDRAALAAGEVADRPEMTAAHRPPGTALERAVTQLWADHLGIDGIGADDDFFELGGDSLLAVSILAELERGHGVAVSPVALYLDPTPAGLARALELARQLAS